MPDDFGLTLYQDKALKRRAGTIELGEVALDRGGVGEPKVLYGHNTGRYKLRRPTVKPTGVGGKFIALAIDASGRPGTWASPGQSITPVDGHVEPGGKFAFWVRPQFPDNAAVGEREFGLQVDATAVA